MKITKLNFSPTGVLQELAEHRLMLIRVLNSKLFRVPRLPEIGEKKKELEEVLNSICTIKRNGVWYIRIKTKEEQLDVIGQTFAHMGIPFLFAEPDETQLN